MARSVKEEEYSAKRNEILDAAQRFVYTKGYDQMSVQDILDAVQISKGAFYHYFNSKQALLEALIERMQQEAAQLLVPILEDPDLTALEKLQRLFDQSARWKTDRKEYIVALVRIWYADENVLVRLKVQASLIKWINPILAKVIRQGIQEGSLDTPFPDQAGPIVLSLLQSMGDAFVEKLVTRRLENGDLQATARGVAAYNLALERILGAPPGALQLMDAQTIHEWLLVVPEN